MEEGEGEFRRGAEGPRAQRKVAEGDWREQSWESWGKEAALDLPQGTLKKIREKKKKKTKKKMCGERILPQDRAGHSAAVPMQNSNHRSSLIFLLTS